MKLACVIPVYNEENLIGGCIDNIKPYVEEVLVLVSKRPYYKSYLNMDNTAAIANSRGADVIIQHWSEEHHQRNMGNMILKNYDWVLSMDADMRYTKDNIERLIRFLEETNADAVMVHHECYWKDHNNVLIDDFTPIVAARPKVRYFHINCAESKFSLALCPDAVVHHFAWSIPKDILKKVMTYGHSNEFDGEKWYKEVFLKSTNEEAVMPDGKRIKTFFKPIPEEIKRFL